MIAGVTGEDEKWRYCVEDTNGALSFAVGAMYVRETFHGDSKASVSNTPSFGIDFHSTGHFSMFTVSLSSFWGR